MKKLLNKIHLCDCMDLMAQLPDKSIDLAIVDPPYRDAKDNQPTEIMRKKGGMKKWTNKPDEKYFNELFRVSTNQIVCGGNYFTDFLKSNNNWIIWYKNNSGVNYSMCELLWNSIDIKYTQLFQYRPMGKLSGIHPTEKPTALYRWLLQNYATEGDLIFDSHSGSGSLVIACIELGFNFIACEIDTEYYRDSMKRVNRKYKELEAGLGLVEHTKRSVSERNKMKELFGE